MSLLTVLLEIQPLIGHDSPETFTIPFDKMSFVCLALHDAKQFINEGDLFDKTLIEKYVAAHDSLENDLWEQNHNGTPASVCAFRSGNKATFDVATDGALFSYTFSIMFKHGKHETDLSTLTL